MVNVLFVCSINSERSPTAEQLFHDVPGWIVKSAGTKPQAVVPVNRELLDWADRIYCMENTHYEDIRRISPDCFPKVRILNIEDHYMRNSSKLIITLLGRVSSIEPLDEWLISKFEITE
jgi:predicted protein tyrosine phosphatase